MPPPALREVAEQIRSLLSGRHSRREVSAWAAQWLTMDHPTIEDDTVWRALERLGGADLRGRETEFLYHDVDFHSWLDEVENALEHRGE
jgi:hypothetical protein